MIGLLSSQLSPQLHDSRESITLNRLRNISMNRLHSNAFKIETNQTKLFFSSIRKIKYQLITNRKEINEEF